VTRSHGARKRAVRCYFRQLVEIEDAR